MTQAAKDRKGFLILGAARGDFSKGRKESTKTGIYWVRPEGFLARMVSSRPSAASSSPSSCKQSWPRRQVSRACSRQRGAGLACGENSHSPPAAVSGSALPCPAGPAASPSAYLSAVPPLLCLSSSLSPKINEQIDSISRKCTSLPATEQGETSPTVSTMPALVCDLGPQTHHVASPASHRVHSHLVSRGWRQQWRSNFLLDSLLTKARRAFYMLEKQKSLSVLERVF